MDLGSLAHLLCLPHLASALQPVGKRVAKLSAEDDFQQLFDQAQPLDSSRRHVHQDPLAPRCATLCRQDRLRALYDSPRVVCVLCAFFSDPDWTTHKRDDAGVLDVEMGHHKWQVMQFVLLLSVLVGRRCLRHSVGHVVRFLTRPSQPCCRIPRQH